MSNLSDTSWPSGEVDKGDINCFYFPRYCPLVRRHCLNSSALGVIAKKNFSVKKSASRTLFLLKIEKKNERKKYRECIQIVSCSLDAGGW